MNKQQVIERMCQLVNQVGTEIFQNEVPGDCFCGAIDFNNPIVDKQIVQFIEAAVIEKLKKVQMDPNTYRPFQYKEYERVVKAVKELWEEDETCHGTGKINVIKRVRDLYGYGLKECKRLVEEAAHLNYIKEREDGGHRWYEV